MLYVALFWILVFLHAKKRNLESANEVLSKDYRDMEKELSFIKGALAFSNMKVVKDSNGNGVVVGLNKMTRKPIVKPRMPTTENMKFITPPTTDFSCFADLPNIDFDNGERSGGSGGSSGSGDSGSSSSSDNSYSGGGGDFGGSGSGGGW